MQFFWTYLTTFFLLITGILLILIVLLQRGRGGGLAGAFGGMGGQSAFGTKAGDVFTKITVVLAVVWVGLAALTGFAMRSDAGGRFGGGTEATTPDVRQTEEGSGMQAPEGQSPLTPQGESGQSSPPAPAGEEPISAAPQSPEAGRAAETGGAGDSDDGEAPE